MYFVVKRKLCRFYPALITCIVLVLFLVWLIVITFEKYGDRSEYGVRLDSFQEDYVDRRGIPVVIGHYVGDVGNLGESGYNLTDELINSNLFDPKPQEGHNGQPVIIPSYERSKMQAFFTINRFNLLASDRIPLNRTLPDVRKKRCLSRYAQVSKLLTTSVIIVFHNEAWSTLLRTVISVINKSPREAIAEILLVDDNSSRAFLKESLEEFVSGLSVPVRVIRTGTREGLVRARVIGANQAKGDVLTFLDAHCECTTGWLEPLLLRIAEDRTKVVCPVIDIISDDTLAYVRSFEHHWGGFNWNLHFRWYTLGASEIKKRKLDITEPFRTPAMAGGLFSMDRKYFFDLGAYDEQMSIWGGENLELSFRVWQCGGTVEIVPCSHVGHIFRKSSPYSFPDGVSDVLSANLARVALVWMDQWQEFYFKFNPDSARQRDKQSVRHRMQLRSKLKCDSFEWYLNNIWPQHFFPMNDRFFGQIRSEESDECLTRTQGRGGVNQPVGVVDMSSCTNNLYHMFVKTKSGLIMTDESVCLDVSDLNDFKTKVKTIACSGGDRQKWTHDKITRTLVHNKTGLCLDIGEGKVLAGTCNGNTAQKWILHSVPWR